jgi:hypothetical protein
MAWGVSILLVLPMATIVGGFAGWCLGTSGGEWLKFIGVVNVTDWCGRTGGLLGAVFCSGYVVYRVIGGERAETRQSFRPKG